MKQSTASSEKRIRACVLIAEDVAAIREGMARLLRDEGLTVEVAEDGESAWRVIDAGRVSYRLLITDLDMPRMDGVELIRRVRAKCSVGAPAILVTTAQSGEEALAAGADAVLRKPFPPQEFLSRVMELIEGFVLPGK